MQSKLLIRSLIFLLISHVIILVTLYAYPALPSTLVTILPAPLNTTLFLAMTTIAARAPTFLTRSLTFSNPPYHLSQGIKRNVDPYKVASTTKTRSFTSTSRTASSSAIPHISLHIAASSSGKGRRFQPELNTYEFSPSEPPLGLQQGTTLSEKRRKRPDSGQDAYFAACVGPNPDSRLKSFAIADGVGGWADHGIDPADFSHGLCSYMANASITWDLTTKGPLTPRELLQIGYEAIHSDPEVIGGGTTACVAVADDSGRIRIANLGDSGWLQLRAGRVQNFSNPQTHAFNTPFQLSLTPPEVLRKARIFGGTPLSDLPKSADLVDLGMEHGDVLVLATDGVWDNLDAQDVLRVVSNVMKEAEAWTISKNQGYLVGQKLRALVAREAVETQLLKGSLQGVLAGKIVGEAKSASLNKRRDGPFAKAWNKEYPFEERFSGGKVDDIAVLVVVAVKNGDGEDGNGNLKAKL